METRKKEIKRRQPEFCRVANILHQINIYNEGYNFIENIVIFKFHNPPRIGVKVEFNLNCQYFKIDLDNYHVCIDGAYFDLRKSEIDIFDHAKSVNFSIPFYDLNKGIGIEFLKFIAERVSEKVMLINKRKIDYELNYQKLVNDLNGYQIPFKVLIP